MAPIHRLDPCGARCLTVKKQGVARRSFDLLVQTMNDAGGCSQVHERGFADRFGRETGLESGPLSSFEIERHAIEVRAHCIAPKIEALALSNIVRRESDRC